MAKLSKRIKAFKEKVFALICFDFNLSLSQLQNLTKNDVKYNSNKFNSFFLAIQILARFSVSVFWPESLRREGSIWLHLAVIALLVRMGVRPKTAMGNGPPLPGLLRTLWMSDMTPSKMPFLKLLVLQFFLYGRELSFSFSFEKNSPVRASMEITFNTYLVFHLQLKSE